MNIEHDDDLLARYLERIPVVAVDGEVVSELELDLDSAAGQARYCPAMINRARFESR